MGRFWCTTYRAEWNNTEPKPWLIYDPCDMELFNVITFGFALYANMLIFIYIKCISTSNPSPRRLLFRGHSARCTVNTIACLIEFTLTIDYALSTCGSLVLATVGLLAQLSSGLVCYMLEVAGQPGPMGCGVLAWLVCGLSRALLFVSLANAGFAVDTHVRPPALALSATCCYATAALHLYAMIGRSKINKTDLDLQFFTYKHDLCSWYSRITFYWLTGFLRNCYKHLIQLEDLGQLPNREKSTTQYGRLYDIYLQQKEKYGTSTKVSMWKCYCKAYWKEFLVGGILKMMGDFVGYIGPLGVSVIVNFVAKEQNVTNLTNYEADNSCCVTFWEFLNNGYVMAFIMLISCITQGSFSQASTHILNVEGIRLKSGLQAMLYCKMLKLQQTQVDSTSENGHIINLLSEDTTNIMSSFWIGHYIWAIPLKIIILIYLLYLKLGWSAIIGSACCIVIMIPLQFFIGKKMSSNSKEISNLSDKRLHLTNEVLQGIRLVKLCGWENEFVDRITDARNNELDLLDKDSMYWGSMTFLTHASSVLVSLFCLGLYCLQNGTQLDSGAIFSSLALSNQLTVPLFIFPITVPIIIAAIVSTKRIEEFMSLPEITPDIKLLKARLNKNNKQKQTTNVSWSKSDMNISNNLIENNISEEIDNTKQDMMETEVCVSIKDATFAWPNSKIPVLAVDNLKIEEGKLTIITGKVGSGKTSMLLALLGEMNCLFGEINFKRGTTVAYVSQRTWLLNASVLENIVFGDKYNKSRFKRVIDACALGPDIDILPDKERTIIGDRGIALSGGQQQRVAIARALYSKANIILMDNPLSALDSDVSQHVLFNGIKKSTLNQIKTVIMTTSFASDLSFADTIVLVEAGKIEFFGSLADLETKGVQNMMVKMENQDHGRRTASERWKLFKLVSRIGHQLYRNWPTIECQKKLKKNFGALYGSRYLTHDLLLPTDECGDGDSIIERNHWRTSNKKRERSATIADIQLPRRKPFVDEILENQPATSFHSSIKYRNYPQEKQIQKSLRRHVLSSIRVPYSSNRSNKITQHSIKRKLRQDVNLTEEAIMLEKNPSNVSDISDDHSSDLKCERSRFEDEFVYKSVSLRTYFKYISWSGWTTYICYIILTISWQTSRVIIDFWLSYWSNIDFRSEAQAYWDLVGYSLLCMISIVLSALSNTLGQYGALKARKLVHHRMLNNIILCPLSFFDSTPIGRIDNCFSNDLVIIDKKIGTSMQRLVHFVFLCLCGIIVNAIITPWFLIIVVPICLVYYTVQKFYRCSSRDLQKLEGNLRSPMITHCNETISGLDTIRAFGKQKWFMSEMINRIDNHTKVFLIISSSNRWLGIALDYLGGAIVFVATMVALITTTFFSSAISSAMVGLAINYTLLVPVYLNWVVKFFADLEMYMSAVERTEEFATIPIENYRNENIITRAWPTKGCIVLDKVSVKYNESQEPVISNVSLNIPPGQKVGICGRTGSGKSSLVMSILNMVPIRDGSIMIDGVDINNVPLQSLRSRISVIPQDVKMFGGTIRQNLDLKNEYSDNEIWSSLRMAQMEDTVKLQLGGLEGIVNNSGDNLSNGQKQLLCLARAILQDNVCLIMDEPTSSVDDVTENKLLEAIKKSFNGRTVITIAHRLSTIVDYDRVLILEGGKIVEDTTPSSIKSFPECL